MKFQNPKVYNPSYTVEKKKFSRIYIYILLILVLACGLIYFLFYSSFFQIKNIVIENSDNLEISKIFQQLNGHNIFHLNASKTQDEIAQKYPEVKGAKIIRGLPDTLRIQFQERTPKIVWQTQQKIYLLDRNGVVYKESQPGDKDQAGLAVIKDNNNIEVSLGEKVLSDNFIDFIIEVSSMFNQATGFTINHFEINETLFQVNVITDQNIKIIFDTTRPTSSQLEDLKLFLKDHQSEVIEYIDVRIEGRVYFK